MYLLQNAAIVDASRPEPRAGHVLVEGGTIKEVSDVPIYAADAMILDLRGRTLLPGLTDAHVHITAISLDLAELGRSPQSLIALEAGQILNGMAMRGFTTVRDAGGADFGHVEAVRRGLVIGPRLLISGRALSQTGGHGDLRPRGAEAESFCACHAGKSSFATVVDGVDNVRRAAREELRRGASQIKIMASGGVASPADLVWTLQFAEEEIRAVVAEAASWRTYVMAHAFTPEAISRAVRFGVRSIEHGNLIDRDTARLMAEKGAFIVPTLATVEALIRYGSSYGFPQESLRKMNEVPWLRRGLESLEIAKAAGVKIGFGSDLLGPLHRYQSREFAIRAEIFSPWEVLCQATAVNAELFNLADEIGLIAPGMAADLVVVDGDPLRNTALLDEQGRFLPLIMSGGKLVKQAL